MFRRLFCALLVSATPVAAADVALIVGNADYRNARDLGRADDMAATAGAFEDAGFKVFLGENLGAAELRRLAARFAAEADGSGRIAIALAGHFAASGSDTWLLGADADAPDLFAAGAQGLSLAALYQVAGRAPGQAVVLIGLEERAIDLGAGLVAGAGEVAVPQGVTVLRGETADLADFAADALLAPGRPLAAALASAGEVAASGYVPALPFQPAAPPRPSAPPAADRGDGLPLSGERAAWAQALARDTAEAYADYLRRYPDGRNAASARAAVARLSPPEDPVDRNAAAEVALALGRDQRRDIQRDLTLLGYNTRGIDGIFGAGTRGAIAAWQRANGYGETGFLTAETVARIDAQAARRAAELEAEAAARQAEEDRLDRAYWAETGARGDEAGLRAYLRRYPDGLYADIAAERLRPFDDLRQEAAQAADRRAWEEATARDSVAAYRAYLEDQPRGAFRERAEARIAALEREGGSAAAIRGEEALGLNGFTRNLIESRLDALGLRPGRVDGVFDENTRRAIRRYQATRNLPATGYVSQDTVVRLLADSLGVRGN